MKQTPIKCRSASFRREERTSTTPAIKTPLASPPIVAAPAIPPAAAGPRHELIKLAIDAHSAFYMVARQVDNAVAQPPQRFDHEQLLKFIAKQKAISRRVVTCYEAGCFGYGLHRQIVALGAENLVVAPQDWDERKTGVRTDRTDTGAMLSRLDRYLAGNHKALAVVRVPGEKEEVQRSRVRQRKQFQSDRNRWANQGKSLLLQYGLNCGWSWWRPDRYPKTQATVREKHPQHAELLLRMLGDFQEMVLKVTEKLEALTKEQQQKVRDERPADKRIKGLGELSAAQIQAEIGDWNRFTNRRQVSSYTGLCPGVQGSGGHFTELSVTKHGNQRLRAALVELAWLIVQYQQSYPPARACRAVLAGKNRSAKKKAIVALARKLAVDLWRMETGRSTPAKLGLELLKAA
jgi:transposase